MRDTVPSDIPEHNQLVDNSNLESQNYLKSIEQWTKDNLMELNEKKSNAIIFNFSKKKHQFTTNIMLKNKKIGIINETKLLGLIFKFLSVVKIFKSIPKTSSFHQIIKVDYGD